VTKCSSAYDMDASRLVIPPAPAPYHQEKIMTTDWAVSTWNYRMLERWYLICHVKRCNACCFQLMHIEITYVFCYTRCALKLSLNQLLVRHATHLSTKHVSVVAVKSMAV